MDDASFHRREQVHRELGHRAVGRASRAKHFGAQPPRNQSTRGVRVVCRGSWPALVRSAVRQSLFRERAVRVLRADEARYPDTIGQRFGGWARLLALYLPHGRGTTACAFPASAAISSIRIASPFLEGRGGKPGQGESPARRRNPARLFELPRAYKLIPVALSAALGIVCSAYAETPQAVSKAPSAQAKRAPAKYAAANTSRTVSRKPVTANAFTGKMVTAKAPAPRPTSGKSNAKPSKTTAVASYRRSNQQQPTAERFQEIQQALADRGYFEGTADGQWGSGSAEALKRFQREQSLTDDGKIGSLSLIALGLGPRRAAPPETSSIKSTQP